MRLILDIDGPDLEYFLACARIRDISPTTLGRRLIAAICADLLVVSVLDDGDNYRSRSKGEHSTRRQSGQRRLFITELRRSGETRGRRF